MESPVIVGGVRTPFVKAAGAFNYVPAQELGRLAVRELLERLATQTGGQYWKPADLGKLASSIPFSEAGVTMRETRDLWDLPLVFLVLLALRFSEWWLRRKWGIV